MTLSTTPPTLVSELSARFEAIAEDVNSLWAQNAAAAWNVAYRAEEIASGETELASEDVPIEVVALTGGAAISLGQITGGREGMLKILIADDANITVVHDGTTPKIILAGSANLPMAAGDVLILVNRGGDPDTSTDGYWREISRTLF
jgi:hypothetical protein